jgi:hypothetical protein
MEAAGSVRCSPRCVATPVVWVFDAPPLACASPTFFTAGVSKTLLLATRVSCLDGCVYVIVLRQRNLSSRPREEVDGRPDASSY